MKISVYITSYNQKDYLKEAIDSVLNQTFKPFEILIVDDCSMDGSRELIRSYAKEYDFIKFVLHERNRGVSGVRISALSNISGDYVTYVDGDDIYLPHKLETEVKLLSKGEYDLTFTNNIYVNPDDVGDIKWIWASNSSSMPSPGNMFIETLTRRFPRESLFRMELVKMDLLRKTGFHDEKLKIYEDYDLRIRLARIAKINYSLEPTTKIRISKNGLSKSSLHLHYESFNYIFDKYQDLVEGLPENEKLKVKKRLHQLLQRFNSNSKSKASGKAKIKQKLISLINRI